MSEQTLQITLPFPPSVNGYWRAIRRGKGVTTILSKRGRQYRTDASIAIAGSGHFGLGLSGRLEVSLDLHPPTAAKRDADNYCKGVLDALTHGGVWVDDEQIDHLHILKCPRDKDNPRVLVTITKVGGE